jgi:hypothetical protein
MDTTLATVPQVSQSSWPTEIELVYVTGTTKVKLSLQGRILQTIIRDAFENLRSDLLFENAFPDSAVISRMIRGSLVRAAEGRTFVNGQYNASAACVHQRLLSDEEYESKMIHLVSEVASNLTRLILISAACTDTHLPSGGQGAISTNRATSISSCPTCRDSCVCDQATLAIQLHLSICDGGKYSLYNVQQNAS